MIHTTTIPTIDPQTDRNVPGDDCRTTADARRMAEGAPSPLVNPVCV